MSYSDTNLTGQRALRLPCLYLAVPGMQLHLDYLSRNDVTEAFRVVKESAARGANVGIDEYPDEKSFHESVGLSESFTLKDDNGQLMGLILVSPFYMSRTIPVYLARIFIFSSTDLDRLNAFRYLITLSKQIASDLGLHYCACVMLVFRKCELMLLELKRQKFLVVACLPLGGELVGLGPCETFVLYSELAGKEPVEVSVRTHMYVFV